MPSNMSDFQPLKDGTDKRTREIPPSDDSLHPGPQGPNLKLLYTALAFALAVAIGLALLIVLPFYHRG